MTERNPRDECYNCRHRRAIAGNSHITCSRPDLEMAGEQHGIDHGWFYYPSCFDPVWKTKLCSNFSDEVDASGEEPSMQAIRDALVGAVVDARIEGVPEDVLSKVMLKQIEDMKARGV